MIFELLNVDSRLYQRQRSHLNTRWKAFDEIYTNENLLAAIFFKDQKWFYVILTNHFPEISDENRIFLQKASFFLSGTSAFFADEAGKK